MAKKGKLYEELRTRFQQEGDVEALDAARALLADTQNLSHGDRERLFGFLEGGGKMFLPESRPLLTAASRMPGLDGAKMSKSYGNTISLREDADTVARKIKQMPTDPARGRRTDPGDPEKMPGVAAASGLFNGRHAQMGGRRLYHRRYRLYSVQAAGD